MLEEFEKKRQKQVSSMRAIMDYAMGVIIIILGVLFFFRDQFDFSLNETYKPNAWDKVFGGICVLYGAWRIYRGYKKNYFK
jgi:sulfite exporter TauE/SafE